MNLLVSELNSHFRHLLATLLNRETDAAAAAAGSVVHLKLKCLFATAAAFYFVDNE
jgi:hypothetical protein